VLASTSVRLSSRRSLSQRLKCASYLHPIPKQTVAALQKQDCIANNQKFPAATCLLTEKGKTLALTLIG